MAACEDPILSGEDLLGGTSDLQVGLIDDLPVRSWTRTDEILSGLNLSVGVLANSADPQFGRSYSAMATEINLPVNGLDLGDGLQIDSIVLALDYFGSYGQNDQPVDIVVYELDQEIEGSVNYLTNTQLVVKTPVLGRIDNVVYAPQDSTDTQFGKVAPQLRLRLDDAFGQRLLGQSGGVNFTDDATWQQYFKGVLIATDQSKAGNGAAYFDLVNDNSHLAIHYRTDTAEGLRVLFPISSLAQRVNIYQHNTIGSASDGLEQSVQPEGDSLLYLKAMGGTRIRVEIEGLENIDTVAVNRAELVFTQTLDPDDVINNYEPPAELILFRIDDNGQSILMTDLTDEPSGHFGGSVEIDPDNSNRVRYVFNIARWAQRVMRGEITNNGLYLNVVSGNVLSDRVILGGGTHSSDGLEFRIIYTKI